MATINDVTVLASGLEFPEGPIVMNDGSVVLVEIKRRTLTRVTPEGKVEVIAEPGGGPNGAAIGPDGACYIANDGGCFEWLDYNGFCLPGPLPGDYSGGRIERVDLHTGDVKVLYTECDGHPLRAPNDLVFDAQGGLWFTDHGTRQERSQDRTGIYYCQPDGSSITEAIFPVNEPNGIGLSPAEDKLYFAETWTGRVFQYPLTGPGQVATVDPFDPSLCLAGLEDLQLLDSMGMQADGSVCVATLLRGGITVIRPDGSREHVALPDDYYDPLTTNICFGGPDLKTAYITLSGRGLLVSVPWPEPGLKLNFLNK
jgi:gluconolactonase